MAIVLYNGKYISPAPLYSLSENYVRTTDGTVLSSQFELTLNGTLLPDRGSPGPTGQFFTSLATAEAVDPSINTDDKKFGSLLKKQRALRDLFTINPGEPNTGSATTKVVAEYLLEIKTDDGTTSVLKCKPQISSISFADAIHVVKTDYTITILTNEILIDGYTPVNPTFSQSEFSGFNLKSASDSVTVSSDNDFENSYSVTRTVSAQSYKAFATEYAATGNYNPYIKARNWVEKKVVETGLVNPITIYGLYAPKSGYEYVGHQTSEQSDQYAGSYSVQQTWKFIKTTTSGVQDDFNISMTSRASGPNAISNTHGYDKSFRVSGAIKGFAPGPTGHKKAKDYFTNIIAANNFGVLKTRITETGSLTNPYITGSSYIYGPYGMTISENRRSATVNYEAEFKEKPIDLTSTSFIDFDVNVSQNTKENFVAEIPVPGRTTGPVIQDIKTTNTTKRNISANFVIGTGLKADFQTIGTYRSNAKTVLSAIDVYPTGTQGSNFWLTSFSESLDIFKGTYSFNATILTPGQGGTL
jgi:hypothetical protein